MVGGWGGGEREIDGGKSLDRFGERGERKREKKKDRDRETETDYIEGERERKTE